MSCQNNQKETRALDSRRPEEKVRKKTKVTCVSKGADRRFTLQLLEKIIEVITYIEGFMFGPAEDFVRALDLAVR